MGGLVTSHCHCEDVDKQHEDMEEAHPPDNSGLKEFVQSHGIQHADKMVKALKDCGITSPSALSNCDTASAKENDNRRYPENWNWRVEKLFHAICFRTFEHNCANFQRH